MVWIYVRVRIFGPGLWALISLSLLNKGARSKAMVPISLSCYMVVWIGVEEFLYKGNVGFLGEMLSKIFKIHVFVLAITWPLLIQNELFKFKDKLDFYENKSL